MASTGGHQEYDASLLASAPVATKAQLQSGYNPDLLVEKPVRPPSRQHDLEAVNNNGQDGVGYGAKKQPFYRTRKGIIIIVVVLVIIIAAAVGGGVGGSKKKNHEVIVAPTGPDDSQTGSPPPASANSTSSSTSASSGASQVVGAPDPNSSNTLPSPTVGGVIGRPTESAAANALGQLVGGST